MITGAEVERDQFELAVSLQLIRFSPWTPEGVRVTQETGRYHLSDRWQTQGVRLYPRAVKGVCSAADSYMADFSEQLQQSAPGWLSTSVALRINNCHFRPRPLQFYAREACGIPSGTALWVDPWDDSVTWLLTLETLEVPK